MAEADVGADVPGLTAGLEFLNLDRRYNCGYNDGMESGIRNAKNTLSALIKAAQAGEEVFLTHRGERVAAIVAVPNAKSPTRGRGIWKGRLPVNWEDDFLRAKRQTEADFYKK